MTKGEAPKRRRSRADGELSRIRILDAATAIAAERGYEGTGIALVSAKCGLPASSIYWHFKDKDDLIAAVIERSFGVWLSAWQIPERMPETAPRKKSAPAREAFQELASRTAKALLDAPDFLRLGLMLALERRPTEARARTTFLQVRARAFEQLMENLREIMPDLADADVHLLATYAMAGGDGLFIAKEMGGGAVDLLGLFELHGHAVYEMACRLAGNRGER
jgi:AcrR family transcriptional regulator